MKTVQGKSSVEKQKKPYQAPKLEILGQLAALTQGTNTGPAEPSGGLPTVKKP
jgi:hypothetical protein